MIELFKSYRIHYSIHKVLIKLRALKKPLKMSAYMLTLEWCVVD